VLGGGGEEKVNEDSYLMSPTAVCDPRVLFCFPSGIQSDSKLLLGFPWPINGNPDNYLESSYFSLHGVSSHKTVILVFI
jgi:hypothetical protein